MEQRLDKLIAATGRYSRKEAKGLIRKGAVTVDGAPARAAEQKVPFGAQVSVLGEPIRNQEHLYIMLNKPAGVLCATEDAHAPTVLDLLPEALRRPGLFPAGRLDKDTVGFVLITDDGPLAHRILSPRSHVPKTYRARLDAPADAAALQKKFAEGLVLDGGDQCLPAACALLEAGAQPVVEVVLREGMYHQVKRMFGACGYRVTALERIRIGGLELDPELSQGEARELRPEEIERLTETD